jgi:DNA invertase Pin-like site-specific DNA recombinase
MNLVAYVRSSSSTGNGDSLAAQEDACRSWAASAGYEVVGVFEDDGLSGGLGIEDRPGLASALVEIEGGRAEGLVVHRIDRLARELYVQEAVLAQVWRVGSHVSVYEAVEGEVKRDDPDDPARRFLRQVLGAAAELERGMIAARLRRGRSRKTERGGYVGGSRLHPKYGYDLVEQANGTFEYEPVELEQAAIRRIISLRGEDASYRSVASALEDEGVQPPSGARWYAMTVRRIEQRA